MGSGVYKPYSLESYSVEEKTNFHLLISQEHFLASLYCIFFAVLLCWCHYHNVFAFSLQSNFVKCSLSLNFPSNFSTFIYNISLHLIISISAPPGKCSLMGGTWRRQGCKHGSLLTFQSPSCASYWQNQIESLWPGTPGKKRACKGPNLSITEPRTEGRTWSWRAIGGNLALSFWWFLSDSQPAFFHCPILKLSFEQLLTS